MCVCNIYIFNTDLDFEEIFFIVFSLSVEFKSGSLMSFNFFWQFLWMDFPFLFFKDRLPQFSSVTQLCPNFCDLMDCNTPGFPTHQYLPKLAQTHVHWVCDAIQPSHPLSSPSPPAFNLSQHQGLFKSVSSLHQVARYWGFNLSISLSNEYLGLISLGLTGWISLQSKGLSRVFYNTTVQKQKWEGGSGWGIHVNPWLIHINVWQKPLQYSN